MKLRARAIFLLIPCHKYQNGLCWTQNSCICIPQFINIIELHHLHYFSTKPISILIDQQQPCSCSRIPKKAISCSEVQKIKRKSGIILKYGILRNLLKIKNWVWLAGFDGLAWRNDINTEKGLKYQFVYIIHQSAFQ